jgi:hypothetical protein
MPSLSLISGCLARALVVMTPFSAVRSGSVMCRAAIRFEWRFAAG